MEKNLQKKIVELLRERDASLAELVNIRWREHDRANVIYNLRVLWEGDEIRPILKLQRGLKTKGGETTKRIPTDEELIFTYCNRYAHPTNVAELIDDMCNKKNPQDAPNASDTFVKLYKERGTLTEAIKKEQFLKAEEIKKEQLVKSLKESPELGNWSPRGFTRKEAEKYYNEHFKTSYRETSEEEIERNAKMLAEMLQMGIPGLREKAMYCLTYRDKDGTYPLYDKIMKIKFE